MRGAKYILALTLVMAGASALARNGGYENHYTTTVAGYAGYGNEGIVLAMPTTAAAHTLTYAQCRALANCDLAHENVTSIGDAAFAYSGMASLTIPASVGELGYISFGGCSNLTEVSCDSWNWADGTENLEDKEPFRDCFKLKTLRVSGDAAEPPTSFDVTEIFTELTTVYCPASETNDWETAYPTLAIVGIPEATSTTLGLMNGTLSAAFSAAGPQEAAEIASAMEILLTEEDIEAGLDARYLRVFVTPVGGGWLSDQGSPDSIASTPSAGDIDYCAYVDVNPDTVPTPIIGAVDSAAMTVEQDDAGVSIGISILNAIQGLWYGCEVKDSLADPAFVNDLLSFRRAPEDGTLVIPCTKRTSEAAFFRVKVKASKPTE